MKSSKGVIIDRDSIAVLKDIKKRALESKDTEGTEYEIAMYCGALLFARNRRLIDASAARHLFHQFEKEYEIYDPSAREDHE